MLAAKAIAIPMLIAGSAVVGNGQLVSATSTAPLNPTVKELLGYMQLTEGLLSQGKADGLTMEPFIRRTIGTYGTTSQPVIWESQDKRIFAAMEMTMPWHYPDSGFSTTISRVQDLTHAEDEDETPAQYALSSALDYLYQTQQFLALDFPKGATTVGDDGSIDLYWRKPGRAVQLMIPADDRRTVSVYHRDGSDYGIDKDVTPETLARWLEWFAGA